MQEQVTFNSFAGYKQMIFSLTDDLKKLRDFSEKMELNGNVSAIDEMLKRIAEDGFSVAIVGEWNSGKSTLINALLGRNVLPMAIRPTTAALNKVTYAVVPSIKIEYRDGRVETIEIDKLKDYVTKLTKEGEERARTIKEAIIRYPVEYCRNGVTIIDTPGLNDETAMTEVTLSVLSQSDVALMLIDAQTPFSESDRDFLENKALTSDLGRVLFVVTGIDLLAEGKVEEQLNYITQAIQEKVIARAKDTYGENSEQFEIYKRKIGNVKVYGLSAKKALKAKLNKDGVMLEQSCFPAFESALERFLFEDRGVVTLSAPVSRIKSASMEIMKAVALRESALDMQKEEFSQQYEKAIKEIENIRKEREACFRRISDGSEKAYYGLLPLIDSYWQELEKVATFAVDKVSITQIEEIQEPEINKTAEKLTDATKNSMTKESQRIMERIQATIETALEDEAKKIPGFENYFFKATAKIQTLFAKVNLNNNNDESARDSMVSMVANTISDFGIGSAYDGFKQSGFKGALLGGVTGFAGMGVSLMIAALAIPLTWPVFLIAGLIGTLTSRFAVRKVFPEKQIQVFKENFKKNVHAEIAEMRKTTNIDEDVKNQIKTAFDALKEKIRTETENVLSDTQNQLIQLKVKNAEGQKSSENNKKDLKQMLETVDQICARANEAGRQLAAVLSK